mgnify:FL=1
MRSRHERRAVRHVRSCLRVRRELRNMFCVLWKRRGQRRRVRQFEFRKLETRRDRAAHQREVLRRRTARTKPASRWHDGLEHAARMGKRITQPVDRQPVALAEHPHLERIARVEMPDFVRADPVPRGIRPITQQVIDRR